MSRSTNEIVAEIKTLYGRRHEEKLQIQKDMAELRSLGWTEQQTADATGISQSTVSRWLAAYEEGLTQVGKASRLTPESVQDASDRRVAKRVLEHAPMEMVERIIEKLPKERRQKVAAAAGHRHAQVREAFEEKERNLTPVQRKEREANASTIDDFAARLTAPFVGASIVLHIEQATDELQEINEHNQMTPELEQAITAALIKLNQEFQVASAMAGSWSEEES